MSTHVRSSMYIMKFGRNQIKNDLEQPQTDGQTSQKIELRQQMLAEP